MKKLTLRRTLYGVRFVGCLVFLLMATSTHTWAQLTREQTRDLEFARDAKGIKTIPVSKEVRDSLKPKLNASRGAARPIGKGRISVQVVWQSGKPVSDKNVTVKPIQTGYQTAHFRFDKKTDKDGEVGFGSIPAGSVQVTCFPFSRPRNIVVKRGETVSVRLVLNDGHVLKGTVLDLDAKPVADASIWLLRNSVMAVIAFTNEKGQFRIQGFPFDGNIEATHPKFAPSASQHPSRIRPLGETKVVLVLKNGSGQIDGVVEDVDGIPVGGVKVLVSSETRSYRESFYKREARTNDAGEFSVEGIRRGSASIRIDEPGFQIYVASLNATKRTTTRIILLRGATVTGVLRDQHEDAVPFARVTLRMKSGGMKTSQTDTAADGSFSISDIPQGKGSISFSQGQGRLVQELNLDAGQVLTVAPRMDFGGVVYGKVIGQFGQSLAHWNVVVRSLKLTHDSRPKYQQNTWTNTEGYFVLKGFKKENYWLQLRDRASRLREVIKNVVPDRGLLTIKINNKRMASIVGSLAGTPAGLQGATVGLWRFASNRPQFDLATGQFRFDMVFPGQHTLLITGLGNEKMKGRTLALKPGEHLDLGVVPMERDK